MHTDTVEVDLSLFSPESGVLALLSITAHMRRAEGFVVTFELDFFNMLEGPELEEYVYYEIVTILLSAVILVPAVWNLICRFGVLGGNPKVAAQNGLLHHGVAGGDDHDTMADEKEDSAALLLDLFMIVIPICVAWRMDVAFHSRRDMQHTIETFSKIEWENDRVEIESKNEAFYAGVKQLRTDVDAAAMQMRVVFMTLVVCMLQMLRQTKLHPRLALITGTIAFAAGVCVSLHQCYTCMRVYA